MALKSYILKLETTLGILDLSDVIEFVFAKRYMYYSTSDDRVGRIRRGNIKKAFRLISGSSKWVEVKMKQFDEAV